MNLKFLQPEPIKLDMQLISHNLQNSIAMLKNMLKNIAQ